MADSTHPQLEMKPGITFFLFIDHKELYLIKHVLSLLENSTQIPKKGGKKIEMLYVPCHLILEQLQVLEPSVPAQG